jgi:hypothetical protein
MNINSTTAVEFLGKFQNFANWELRNCFYVMFKDKNVKKAMKCENAKKFASHRIAKKRGKKLEN